MTNNTFKNKTVVITGASSGIGWEMAKQLAEQGANLVLAARQADKLVELANLCYKLGGKAVAIPTDVSDPSQCSALIEAAVKAFGEIDVLINNAGTTMWARLDEITDLTIFEKIMQVNYLGSVYCTYFALPYLKASKGRLAAVSSLTGKAGVPTRTGYAASKHAMVGFFDSLRVELRGSGVSVTMIYPGFVDTGVQERGFGADGKPLGVNPLQLNKIMTTPECAQLCIKAIADRRREEVMTLRGKLGQWIKLIAPGLVDQIAAKAIEDGK
ncbi:MAG: short chain dehydrogenase [Anaerolinea sp.]|nr:short chain dehydrogenase [Anaerolinea sp.]